ncbi:MAG: GDP-mannose 4,6-dehydratase [Prevotella sp.]|nr:GDP-mannose 4,6-dehydratase [Prevotella sp.]
MKTIILAAGYATRLYPFTENFPKPLLKVGNKTILDWLIDDISTSGLVDEYIVVSNHKFAHHFQSWAEGRNDITIIDDGTMSNETRRGAVVDVQLAIEHCESHDDVPTDGYLVIAGDNLLDFSLTRFISYALEKQTSCITRYYEPSEKKLLKCGVVTIDDNDRILQMTEKSPTPATHWACPPFYYYTHEDAKLVKRGIESGCGTDAPGSYIAWLCTKTAVHAMEMPGRRFDIGNLESYEMVKKEYRGIALTPNVDIDGKTILVTGAAGFIGSNLVMQLLKTTKAATIIGIDNMNDYYDVRLKENRLNEIQATANDRQFVFFKASIADKTVIDKIFAEYNPDIVVNLAAQAGVRYSITNPDAYIESNIIGFYNILEACRHSYDSGRKGVEHLVYASSSSVYGSNKKVPYSTDDKVDNPVSLYAATKKSNELLAHSYSKLYNIPSTGLRFFTVYGPAGRPDMAYFGFTDKLVKGETIKIFNYGNCKRDFTYVEDIVEGVSRVITHAPERRNGSDGLPIPPYAIYNIGNNNPENLLDFVTILQEELIRARVLPEDYDFEAHKQLVAMQPGDVPITYADTSALERDFGFKPSTPLRIGLRHFAEWYAEYYGKAENK